MKFMICAILGLSLMSSVVHAKICTLTVEAPGAEKKSMVLESQAATRDKFVLVGELENFKASYVRSIIYKTESLSLSSESTKAQTSSPMAQSPALNLKLEQNGARATLSCLDL